MAHKNRSTEFKDGVLISSLSEITKEYGIFFKGNRRSAENRRLGDTTPIGFPEQQVCFRDPNGNSTPPKVTAND